MGITWFHYEWEGIVIDIVFHPLTMRVGHHIDRLGIYRSPQCNAQLLTEDGIVRSCFGMVHVSGRHLCSCSCWVFEVNDWYDQFRYVHIQLEHRLGKTGSHCMGLWPVKRCERFGISAAMLRQVAVFAMWSDESKTIAVFAIPKSQSSRPYDTITCLLPHVEIMHCWSLYHQPVPPLQRSGGFLATMTTLGTETNQPTNTPKNHGMPYRVKR